MNFSEIYHQYMYSYPHKTAYRRLPDIPVASYLLPASSRPLSLYLHIPFCESKCGYCNLFSVTGQDAGFMEKYLNVMEKQAEQYLHTIEITPCFDSLTIGGGTPLFLSEKHLERLFGLTRHFSFLENSPVIVETSPRQTTQEKLEILKQNNTTRISIGIQSFHEDELEKLNRRHSVSDCKKALDRIGTVGFSCRNIDLIYGIPGQTKRSFQYSIDAALFYEPEELFLYPLYVKQGTGLYQQNVCASQQTYQLYQFMSSYLRKHGYTQISMRRFVKITTSENHTDSTDTHTSCGFENTLSLGCGGRSYLENLHFCTPYHVQQSFCRKELEHFLTTKDHTIISFGYLLSAKEMLRRYVIKNLLHRNGLEQNDYSNAKRHCFLSDSSSVFEDFPVFSELLKDGLVKHTENRVFLTEKGLSLSDAIGPLFISEEVTERMQTWSEEAPDGA